MFLDYSIERKTTYWGKNMEMENVGSGGMPGETPPELSRSKSVTISLHRQVKVSSISPEDLLLTVNKTAQEIDELKQVFLRSTTREDRAQIGPIIQRKFALIKYLVVSNQGTFQNLSPDQKHQFDTAMETFFTAMRGFNQAVLQHQRMTEALQILGQIQAEIADHCNHPEKPREPLKEKVQEAERSLQSISKADLEKMTRQERRTLETTLRSISLDLYLLEIKDTFDQLRSNLKAVEDAYVEEQKMKLGLYREPTHPQGASTPPPSAQTKKSQERLDLPPQPLLDTESTSRAQNTDPYLDLTRTDDTTPLDTAELWLGIYDSGRLTQDEINGLKLGLAFLLRKDPTNTRLLEIQKKVEEPREETHVPKTRSKPEEGVISQLFSKGRAAIAQFLSRKKGHVAASPASLLTTLEDTKIPLSKRVENAARLCTLAGAGVLELGQYQRLLTKMNELSKELQEASDLPNKEEIESFLQYGREEIYDTPASYLKDLSEHNDPETMRNTAENFKTLIAGDSRVSQGKEQRTTLLAQVDSLSQNLKDAGIQVQISIPERDESVQEPPSPPEGSVLLPASQEEEPQPSSEKALAAQGRGQEAQGASQPNAHTAVRTLSTAVAQLTSRKAKLRLDSGELKKTTRSVLPKNIMEALGRVGHSAESQEAGDKMVGTLMEAVSQFDSLTMDERIQCLNALKDLENNAWFKGYLSHASETMKAAYEKAKTDLELKVRNSFTSILKMAEGPDKQRSLTEAKSALEQLRRQHWSPELQTSYGKILKALLESPMEVSLLNRFNEVDSSQRHAVPFGGQQPTPKAQGLITSTGKDRFWTDDVRTHYAEHTMTQAELEESVVFARNPALSPERQQYLLAGRPQKKGKSLSRPQTSLDLPMSTKAGDEKLLDRGGLITEQEASLGSGVVGFARVKLSSVLTPGNSSVGQGAKLIGVMHDQEGSIQYIDAVVVSTAHLDFESPDKGDAHALALEDEAIEGSPFMPEALSEEERKKPELVAQYNKQLKQYQVFLYTKSGRIPSKKEAESGNILTYEEATSQIGALIRDGKSKEDIDKFLEGKCVKASNGSLYPLEMIFRKYLQTTKTVFGGLEGGCPQGYTYSIDPPNEFIKLFGKDPRLITRMQTLCLAYMKQEGASFTHLQALGLSTYIAPGGTRPQATVDTEGLQLLQRVIPQTVDKSDLFVRDPHEADFMVPAKEITLADGTTVPSGVFCMNDLRDPYVFYGSHEKDASTEGRLAMMSNYAQIMGALSTPGMTMPILERR